MFFKVFAGLQLDWLCRLIKKCQNDAFRCNHQLACEFIAADSQHYLQIDGQTI